MPGRGARLTARGEQVGGVYLLPGAVARGGSTLVGNAFGAGRPAEARAVAGQVALLAAAVQALQVGALWLLRREVGALFTPSAALVARVADALEPWGLLFCAVGGVQTCLAGVLEGAAKQRVAAPLVALAYWAVGLPVRRP